MIILIDQDGVIADIEKGFLDQWRILHPDEFFVPLDKRKSFYIRDDYPKELIDKINDIFFAKDFYLNLPPVQGGLEAVKTMFDLGHDVRICTSPLTKYKYCVTEKYQWVEEHLGEEFTKQIVLSKDKTIVKGDFLIDDRPIITGVTVPDWRHALFDRPYNRNVYNPLRLTWKNWREVITI